MAEEKNVPWQNKTVMLVAVGVAVVAVILNWIYVSGVENKTEQQYIPVWRARDTLPGGRRVTEADVVQDRVPAPKPGEAQRYVMAGDRSELTSIKDLPLRRRVDRDEPLVWTMFTYDGATHSADETISPLWRAVTVDIDGRSASPLVRPGSRIDLHCVLQLPGADDKPMPPEVRTMLEEVEVLAVGNIWRPEEFRSGASGANFTKLTLLLPNELIEDLMTILRLVPPPGLVLRNPSETSRGSNSTQWLAQARARLTDLKRQAQSQKIPFDRGVGSDRL